MTTCKARETIFEDVCNHCNLERRSPHTGTVITPSLASIAHKCDTGQSLGKCSSLMQALLRYRRFLSIVIDSRDSVVCFEGGTITLQGLLFMLLKKNPRNQY